ncbi:hypothetical protein PCE1_003059 [Barthelona sp. PCE]
MTSPQDFTPEQLKAAIENMEREINLLTSHYGSLRQISVRLNKAVSVIDDHKDGVETKELLVPITESIYLPGQIAKTDFLVGIGGKIYVERNAEQAKTYFEGRHDELSQQIQQLEGSIQDRTSLLRSLKSLFIQKTEALASGNAKAEQ